MRRRNELAAGALSSSRIGCSKHLRICRQERSGGADVAGLTIAELVFTSPAGRPIYSDKLAKRFKAILRQAGLPMIRLYDLRHTAATLALAAGVPPKVVAEQLGHASAAFTLDVYSHLLPHMQEQAAMKVEQILVRAGSATAPDGAARSVIPKARSQEAS